MPINAMITEDDLLSGMMLCDLLEDYLIEAHLVPQYRFHAAAKMIF